MAEFLFGRSYTAGTDRTLFRPLEALEIQKLWLTQSVSRWRSESSQTDERTIFSKSEWESNEARRALLNNATVALVFDVD